MDADIVGREAGCCGSSAQMTPPSQGRTKAPSVVMPVHFMETPADEASMAEWADYDTDANLTKFIGFNGSRHRAINRCNPTNRYKRARISRQLNAFVTSFAIGLSGKVAAAAAVRQRNGSTDSHTLTICPRLSYVRFRSSLVDVK
jgi:hypothetical protein